MGIPMRSVKSGLSRAQQALRSALNNEFKRSGISRGRSIENRRSLQCQCDVRGSVRVERVNGASVCDQGRGARDRRAVDQRIAQLQSRVFAR
jgi:hypothetical protein